MSQQVPYHPIKPLEYKLDGGTGVPAPSDLNCANPKLDVSVDCGRDDPHLQEPAVKDLTYKQILALKPGRHWVSECLYVFVTPNGQTRRFIFRFTKPTT